MSRRGRRKETPRFVTAIRAFGKSVAGRLSANSGRPTVSGSGHLNVGSPQVAVAHATTPSSRLRPTPSSQSGVPLRRGSGIGLAWHDFDVAGDACLRRVSITSDGLMRTGHRRPCRIGCAYPSGPDVTGRTGFSGSRLAISESSSSIYSKSILSRST